MSLRHASLVAACVAASFGPVRTVESAIILVGSDVQRLDDTGFYRMTISAVGTDGEVINTISGIELSGDAHQVFGLFDTITPGIDDVSGPAWNDAWTPFDTHVLIPHSQRVGTVGMPLRETNGGETTGTLGLPNSVLGAPPKSGFGTLSSFDRTDSFALLPAASSSNVPFLQVVSRHGSGVNLSVRIDGRQNGTGVHQAFSGFQIGPIDLPPVIPGGAISSAYPDQLQQFDFRVGVIDEEPLSLLKWAYLGAQKDGVDTAPANAPQLDMHTGEFSWVPHVSDLMGQHVAEWKFSVQAVGGYTNHGLPGMGMLTITLNIPEPSGIWLMSLAAAGLAGLAGRCRR